MKRVPSPFPILMCVLILSQTGCDKKISGSTIAQMRSVRTQALLVAKISESIDGKVAAVTEGKDEVVAEIVANLSNSFGSIAYGMNSAVQAVEKKSKFSEQSAKMVTMAQATITSNLQIIQSLKAKLKPKTPEDSGALTEWTTDIETQVVALADAFARMNVMILSDVTPKEDPADKVQ